MILLAFILTLAGFACLALAMDRHRRTFDSPAASSATRMRLRWSGGAVIALGGVLCVLGEGWSRGLTWWAALATVAAFCVLAVLTIEDGRRSR